ncbi:hypothetical protein CC80DRAFT_500626 [Byssothecium circinans]|uniref:Uncharacterized protein n=1 Tax=Byssothecium circinans TaxID=147558 RepID=A0A6A5U9F5_9PLEO|nr:hypothetical protein CC80DRAFT_500626 [Byssothecium circinans]
MHPSPHLFVRTIHEAKCEGGENDSNTTQEGCEDTEDERTPNFDIGALKRWYYSYFDLDHILHLWCKSGMIGGMQRIRGGERLQGPIKGRRGWQKRDGLATNIIYNRRARQVCLNRYRKQPHLRTLTSLVYGGAHGDVSKPKSLFCFAYRQGAPPRV